MDVLSVPIKKMNYQQVLKLPGFKHQLPAHGLRFVRYLCCKYMLNDLSDSDLSISFKPGTNKLIFDEPALYFMNHSSAIDVEVLSKLFKNKTFYLLVTHDGFIGRNITLRHFLCCVPTKKFITDLKLIDDINYISKKFKKPIVMFPEASWCLGGVQSKLPESLGGMLKYFKLPVYNIKTFGAYQRCPQYNDAHNKSEMRNVNISAQVEFLFSKKDLSQISAEEINKKLKDLYTYDHFRWQYENKIIVDNDFRAKGLHHVLYKCPHCNTEGQMDSEGITVKCMKCGKEYELTKYGKLKARGFTPRFQFVSDWYYWEEQCVKDEINNSTYYSKSKAKIQIVKDTKAFYDIGEGFIIQDKKGITITDLNNNLIFEYLHKSSYSLYADFHFYGAGDIISVGNNNIQYYCFTDYKDFPVLKARFAAEEAYRLFKLGKV